VLEPHVWPTGKYGIDPYRSIAIKPLQKILELRHTILVM